MTVYVAFRAAADYVSPGRVGEARILCLWSDYTATTALVGLAAAWLPGVFA